MQTDHSQKPNCREGKQERDDCIESDEAVGKVASEPEGEIEALGECVKSPQQTLIKNSWFL